MLTRWALNYKTTIYVAILIIVLAGMSAYRSLPLESAPEIEIPVLLVHTLYPGVAPEDMERLVTNVLERELSGVKDVKKMTSTSAESISTISIEFETDVNMDDAYQKVRDKVDLAKPDLPEDAEEPTIMEINFSEWPIMLVNVLGDYSLERLKRIAEGIQERIEQIPGILRVDMTGGLEREIQVWLDPHRMDYYNVSLGNVIGRIQEEHLTMPAGNLDLGGSKYAVRIPAEYRDVSEMEDIVLKAPDGNPVRIGDVGRVVDGFAERETISRANGVECVTLRVVKRAGENIVEIAEQVRALLAEMEPALPAGTSYLIRQDQSEDILDMVRTLENSLITALILVLAVLFFAMGLRNAGFVAFAIPTSMLITFIVIQALGITLNMVVLFSLILALGMLVDNSIVVIENIFRHSGETGDKDKAALTGTLEVAWPIIASTFTTVAAFAPLIFWPGIMGEFMGFLPRTVIPALLASLGVALLINPVIAATFLTKETKPLFDDSGQARGPVMTRYETALRWSLDHPWTLIGVSNVILISVFILFANFNHGVELFPDVTPRRAQVKIKAPQGTRLEETDRLMRKVERIAQPDPNVEHVVANVGFGGDPIFGGGSGASHEAVADVEFLKPEERVESTWDTIDTLRDEITGLAGAEFQVEKEEEGPPTGDPVSIEISGEDFTVLAEIARKVKKFVDGIEGVVDIRDDFEGAKPEVRIVVDRTEAKRRRVSTRAIAQAVRTAINGTEASVLREGDEEYDIVVRYDAPFRRGIDDILNINVAGEDDVRIPLRDVAQVETTGGLGAIKHIDQDRTILVSGEVVDISSDDAMKIVQADLERAVPLPPGYQYRFSGETEEQQKAAAFLEKAFGIGLGMIALILITQFNSVLRPSIILGSVVMSLIGVLLGLLVTGTRFGIIMTGMGVISLGGVVVNNAIVLIDYIDQLKARGHELKEALIRAGLIRFRPVLLTAITTILGMVPMAIGVSFDFTNWKIESGTQSSEWWGPMAVAVIFGLAFATLLTLIMVPVMYLVQERMTDKSLALLRRLMRRQAPEEAPAEEAE